MLRLRRCCGIRHDRGRVGGRLRRCCGIRNSWRWFGDNRRRFRNDWLLGWGRVRGRPCRWCGIRNSWRWFGDNRRRFRNDWLLGWGRRRFGNDWRRVDGWFRRGGVRSSRRRFGNDWRRVDRRFCGSRLGDNRLGVWLWRRGATSVDRLGDVQSLWRAAWGLGFSRWQCFDGGGWVGLGRGCANIGDRFFGRPTR